MSDVDSSGMYFWYQFLLNHLLIISDQTQIIRRAYVKAKKGLEFKTIRELLQQPTDLDGFLYRCGIQRGDVVSIAMESVFILLLFIQCRSCDCYI
jgi:hypothetical protein